MLSRSLSVVTLAAVLYGCRRSPPAGDTSPSPAALEALRHQSRVALVFTPSPEDPRLEAQRALWRGSEVGFSDRDLVVLEGRTTSELGATYGIRPTAFAMVLVGKDGHTAFRSDVPVAASDLFQRIDAMPMRREEMRVRGR